MHKIFMIAIIATVIMIAAVVKGQAPASSGTLAAEQGAITKAMLEKDAVIGELLKRASSCEARMWDLPALKARVAELEAMQKKGEPQNGAPTAPNKP